MEVVEFGKKWDSMWVGRVDHWQVLRCKCGRITETHTVVDEK